MGGRLASPRSRQGIGVPHLGVQRFDAVRKFLEEQEGEGAFTILDDSCEDQFWAYWRNDGYSFIPEGEAAELLTMPMWLQTEADQ